jgi:long-chain fatty acid transport protein
VAIVDSATSGHDDASGKSANGLGDSMSIRGLAGVLRAGSALGLLVVATAQANAGGFALREQSTYGQGTSFAGIAAGGALSSMFWNPATMTQFADKGIEVGASAIFPFANNTPIAGTLVGPPFNFGGTTDTGMDALVPNAYFTYQFNSNLWLGLAVNSPFGLSADFPEFWAGRNYGANSSKLKTYNAAPSLAYRFNDWISVGIGAQIQFARVTLNQGLLVPTQQGVFFPDVTLHGDDWAFGLTAGVTITPTPTTTIGIGYRSGLNQKIDGSLVLTSVLGPFSNGSVHTTVDLPDVVSLGVRQRVTPQLTLLGTAEWSNWSRIGTSNILQASGAPALINGNPVKIPFEYRDGWFFSGGAEYQWSDRLTLRSGVAYEISPVTDQVRIPLVPDNNRVWASIGASWQVWKGFSFDLAYSHIWVKDPSINVSLASGNPQFTGVTYIGDSKAHVDILSLALVFRWGAPEPAPRPIVTK